MRLAIVTDSLLIPSETFVIKQITGLLDLGWEVDILVSQPSEEGSIHPDVERFDLRSLVIQPKVLPDNKLKRAFSGFIYMMTHAHKSPKVMLKSLNVPRYGRHAATLRLMTEGMKYSEQEPYDIIHCHFGPNGIRGMNLREIGAIHGRLVTTFWGYDVSSYVQQHGPNCYQKLFREGDLFIAISMAMMNRLISLGCDEGKINYLPTGVDLSVFSRSRYHKSQVGVIQLLSIGRFVPKKGFADGIRVLAELIRADFNVKYTIIGSGELKKNLEALAAELHVSGKIEFAGWESEAALVDILAKADIFLAPSRTGTDGDQEGTPLVILEAMAMGLPVISTIHSGIPEMVEDSVTGFLVPEGDIAFMKNRTIELIESENLRSQMGTAGRRQIEAKYDLCITNNTLSELFRNLF